MLVLSRNREQTIMIGDNVEITVVDIKGEKVRLGINAPRQVKVHRKEIYESIQKENAAASRVHADDLPTIDQAPASGQRSNGRSTRKRLVGDSVTS